MCVCARYNARVAYARTTAVISMIGYVLGLGDRHGENILFDSTNGDTVHVDFNCLFNRVGACSDTILISCTDLPDEKHCASMPSFTRSLTTWWVHTD